MEVRPEVKGRTFVRRHLSGRESHGRFVFVLGQSPHADDGKADPVLAPRRRRERKSDHRL